MSYKSLLTIIRSTDDADHQIAASARLAQQFDAHLEIICIGIDEVQMGYYFAGSDSLLQNASIDLAREKSETIQTHVEKSLQGLGIRWSARGVVSQYGVLNEVISHLARFADLVILPAPYGKYASPENEAILEGVLFAGIAPALVIPDDGLPSNLLTCAVIGWDDSSEALRASRAALPILVKTKKTSVTVIEKKSGRHKTTQSGQSLAAMLDRHGVNAQLDILSAENKTVSETLLAHVADEGADLLVVGAYGHSRFREAILGGATRDLMNNVTVPLLMAH